MQVADSSLAEMSLQLFDCLGALSLFLHFLFSPRKGKSWDSVHVVWMPAAAKVGRCCKGWSWQIQGLRRLCRSSRRSSLINTPVTIGHHPPPLPTS